MRFAFVTSRARSAVSVAAPYLASEFGTRNVLVLRLPDVRASAAPVRRVIGRRIDRWSSEGAGIPMVQAVERSGVALVHTRDCDSAKASLRAFKPDLVVGVGLGDFAPEFGVGVPSSAIELRYGAGHEETPEAAILWAVHGGEAEVDVVYVRMEEAHRQDVVYQEPVPIPFQSSLQATVRQGVARLHRRAGAALAEFAGWSAGLLERAVSLDSASPRGTPSWGDLRVIRERHGRLRRRHLTQPAAAEGGMDL